MLLPKPCQRRRPAPKAEGLQEGEVPREGGDSRVKRVGESQSHSTTMLEARGLPSRRALSLSLRRERERERQRETETDRDRQRQTETETERERQRQTERERERGRETEREREKREGVRQGVRESGRGR